MADKHGRKSNKPSHKRYNGENRRQKNKEKRILKSNGTKYLARWQKETGGTTQRMRVRAGK